MENSNDVSNRHINQFPRPARKNGHPILSSRFLSRVLVITISSHFNRFTKHYRADRVINRYSYQSGEMALVFTFIYG